MLVAENSQNTILSIRTCEYSACSKCLGPLQKKFCSNACRNKAYVPGRSGGRPAQYRPEFAHQVLDDYLFKCLMADELRVEKVGRKYKEIVEADIPTRNGFCIYLWKEFGMSVHRNTLTNWARAHRDFYIALERIKDIQCMLLVNNGLSGRYNATFVSFLLRNNHKGSEWKF
jgi:DNA-packaging protein gp3